MINLNTQYGSVAAPISSQYPTGGPQNSTTPGALNGFPLEEAWLQDKEGFFQKLISETGISISGNADTVLASDSFDALSKIITANILKTGTGSIDMGNYSGSVKLLILSNSSGGDITLSVNDVPSGNYEQAPVLEFYNFGGNLLKIQATGIGGVGTEFVLYSNTYLRIFWDDTNNTYRLISTSRKNQRTFMGTDITTDQTIGNDPLLKHYFVNSGTNGVYMNLPDAVLNKGLRLTFTKTDSNSSAVTLKPNGSQKINDMNFLFLIYKDQNIIIESNGANWVIVGGKLISDSGYINTNDWTTRHFGAVYLVLNDSSGFEIGENIQESTSNWTGIIVAIIGNTLILQMVTGDGYFTNGRAITGLKSSATDTVNGNTKNVDSEFYYGYNIEPWKTQPIFVYSSNKIGYNIYQNISEGVNNDVGAVFLPGISNNYTKIQTGIDGVLAMGDAGNVAVLATNDEYYRITMKWTF